MYKLATVMTPTVGGEQIAHEQLAQGGDQLPDVELRVEGNPSLRQEPADVGASWLAFIVGKESSESLFDFA